MTTDSCVIVIPVGASHSDRLDNILPEVPRSGPYHITLTYLPGLSQAKAGTKLLDSVQAAVAKASPLILEYHNLIPFDNSGDGYPAVLAIATAKPANPTALHDLKALIDHELKQRGVEYSQKWPVFKPHLTIGYTEQPVQPRQEWHSWVPMSVEIWYGMDAAEGKDIVPLPLGQFYRTTDNVVY